MMFYIYMSIITAIILVGILGYFGYRDKFELDLYFFATICIILGTAFWPVFALVVPLLIGRHFACRK